MKSSKNAFQNSFRSAESSSSSESEEEMPSGDSADNESIDEST